MTSRWHMSEWELRREVRRNRNNISNSNSRMLEWKALAASRLELLRRVAEFLEANNPNHPILREIKEELGND